MTLEGQAGGEKACGRDGSSSFSESIQYTGKPNGCKDERHASIFALPRAGRASKSECIFTPEAPEAWRKTVVMKKPQELSRAQERLSKAME